MGRKALAYLAGLTGLYIIIYRSTNTGIVLDHGASAVSTAVSPFLK